MMPHALSARFDRRNHKVWVRLNSGIDFSFDPRLAYGLQGAAADDLVGVIVEGAGSTLHIPKLDADFSVARILEPLVWTRREKREVASRANGKRGGRPRKAADQLASEGLVR